MAKTKQTVIKPVPGASCMPDGDLLQRVNAVHDGISNNPAHRNLPVDISLRRLADWRNAVCFTTQHHPSRT
jgi:hypothetical protein